MSTYGASIAGENAFGVTISLSVGSRTVPLRVTKIGEMIGISYTKETKDQAVPKGAPPLGWSLEITPTADKNKRYVSQVVIKNVTLDHDKSEFPVTTFIVSTFNFSLPVDGVEHSKDFPGLGKVTLRLQLIDAYGNNLKTEQAGAGSRTKE